MGLGACAVGLACAHASAPSVPSHPSTHRPLFDHPSVVEGGNTMADEAADEAAAHGAPKKTQSVKKAQSMKL